MITTEDEFNASASGVLAIAELIDEYLNMLKHKNVVKKIKEGLREKLVHPNYNYIVFKLITCMRSGKAFHLNFALIKNSVKVIKIAKIIANALNNTEAAKFCKISFTPNEILKLFRPQPFSNRSAGHGEIAFILLPFDSKFSNNDGAGDIKIKYNGIEYGIEIKCPGNTRVSNLANTLDSENINAKISIIKFTYYVNDIIKKFISEFNIPLAEVDTLTASNVRYSISPKPYKTFDKGKKTKYTVLHIADIVKQLGDLAEKYSSFNSNVINDSLNIFVLSILKEFYAKIYLNLDTYDENISKMIERHTPEERHYNDSYYYLFKGYDSHLMDESGHNRWNTCPFINEWSLYITKKLGNKANFILAINGDFENVDNFNAILIDKSLSVEELMDAMDGYHFINPDTHNDTLQRFATQICVH